MFCWAEEREMVCIVGLGRDVRCFVGLGREM